MDRLRIRDSSGLNGVINRSGRVSFSVEGSIALLDDVSLTEAADTNPTAFRRSVVATLQDLKPGLLRYWGGQLGDTLENQLAPLFARERSGYSAFSSEANEIQIGLNDFLQLCAAAGSEPYYVVPITFTPREMRNLIEFLAGPAGTPYGKIRAHLGRREPWVTQFPAIHLQFGNEPWNAVFKGGNIEYTIPYANRADEIFEAARDSPYYTKTKFDPVLCGRAVYVERNQELAQTSRKYDTLTVGPYLQTKLNSFATNENLFAPLFAEPRQISSPRGYMSRNAAIARGAGLPVALSIYETNIDPREGAISQEALDRFAPSLGAGLGVIENTLIALGDLGIKDQMFWLLPQYNLKRPDGKLFKLRRRR